MCFRNGAVAQSVEQRTENPCVGGSIPPHTTKGLNWISLGPFFIWKPAKGDWTPTFATATDGKSCVSSPDSYLPVGRQVGTVEQRDWKSCACPPRRVGGSIPPHSMKGLNWISLPPFLLHIRTRTFLYSRIIQPIVWNAFLFWYCYWWALVI